MDLSELLTREQSTTLQHIRKFVTDLWARGAPEHPFHTLHGPQHSRQVEMIVGHVLGAEYPGEQHGIGEILTLEQLFYVLAAAWLHDVGMVYPVTDEEKRTAHEEGVSIADWIRDTHHKRSYDYVVEHADELHLASTEATIIATVCLGHRKVPLIENKSFSSAFPDVEFLAALLRIADELDITHARTPEQLMQWIWADMDYMSKWHWLKHWCVQGATPYYQEWKTRHSKRLMLTYHLITCLPSVHFEMTFLDLVLNPVRKVLQDEGVDRILERKGLGVALESFQQAPLFGNRAFPDGTDLKTRLEQSVFTATILPSDTGAALEKLRPRLCQPTYELLKRQCRRLANVVEGTPSPSETIDTAVADLLSSLQGSNDLGSIEKAKQEFEDAIREMLNSSSEVSGAWHDDAALTSSIESECLSVSLLAYRLLAIATGDHATRLSQITHLLIWRGRDANDFAVWLLSNDADPEVTQVAVGHLANKGTADCYHAVLQASQHPSPRVREKAATALGRLAGPETLQRLVEIIRYDVDGEVRQAAYSALQESVSSPAQKHKNLAGRRVLIMDEEQSVVSLLVDALNARGVDVRVTTNADELKTILTGWVPDAVVCDLLLGISASCPFDYDATRGMSLARLVRESLGPYVPIVAASSADPEDIALQLARIHAIYVRKPTTFDKLVRAIESLLQQPPHPTFVEGQPSGRVTLKEPKPAERKARKT